MAPMRFRTPEENAMIRCNEIMDKQSFSYTKRTHSIIWAAKFDACPTCEAEVGKPCVNMADKKAGKLSLRINKQPHPTRINWYKLKDALETRFSG